jgi:hypothetical protein
VKNDKNGDGFRTVRIYADTHKRIQDLIAQAKQSGWAVVGAERDDFPITPAIVDEAIRALEERAGRLRKS